MDYRKELIKKLNSGGPFYENELLNAILSNAYGGRDMSAVSQRLLARFPCVYAILEADYAELASCEGVPAGVARYLKTLGRLACRQETDCVEINGTAQCFELIKGMCTMDVETAEVYLVNKSGKLLYKLFFNSGELNSVEMPVKTLMNAINAQKGVYGVYFAHNHVNCSVEPSAADDEVTRRIICACAACGVRFLDHCIINTGEQTFSYAQSGRLSKIASTVK